VERFALATRDRFFLLVRARDKQFDLAKTKEFLQGLQAREVSEVEV
jgi:Alternative complex III, ActD subunit